MLPKLRKLSRACEVIARTILLRTGSGRSHLYSEGASDMRFQFVKGLQAAKARPLTGAGFLFFGGNSNSEVCSTARLEPVCWLVGCRQFNWKSMEGIPFRQLSIPRMTAQQREILFGPVFRNYLKLGVNVCKCPSVPKPVAVAEVAMFRGLGIRLADRYA
jgi:hypothetical protein